MCGAVVQQLARQMGVVILLLPAFPVLIILSSSNFLTSIVIRQNLSFGPTTQNATWKTVSNDAIAIANSSEPLKKPYGK